MLCYLLSFCDDFNNNMNPYKIWLCEITLGYCYFVMKIYIYIASLHFATMQKTLHFARPSFDFLPPYTPQKNRNIITMSQVLDFSGFFFSHHITLQKKDNNTNFRQNNPLPSSQSPAVLPFGTIIRTIIKIKRNQKSKGK